MRELWGHKIGLAVAVVLATLAASRFVFSIGLIPPRIEGDSIGLASASTRVLVDTPRSSAVDLRQNTYSLNELTSRALLLGNVMASPAVRNYIARRSGLPPQAIRVSAPFTLDHPRALPDSGEQPKSSDILKSPHEYRLSIEANPTVPILDIYAEAPTVSTAVSLANGAVKGLHEYLRVLADNDQTPRSSQVRVTQLGRATGGSIADGASPQLAILAFALVFSASCAAILFIARIRRGWAASEERTSHPVGGPA